jgi:hypothetical protein
MFEIRNMISDLVFSASTAVLILLVAAVSSNMFAEAQVRQSSSYAIQSDSVNIGGGLSSSTQYVGESTVGEIATGESSSASYGLNAGFQQQQSVYLALTSASDVVMSPALGGITGGTSNGSTEVLVTTDNPGGYQLSIEASSSPAMTSGANSIADYTPVGVNPDFTFTTDATDAHFGYSPDGTEIASRFRDNGASCNTDSGTTTLACWDGLSTTAEVIAESTSGNHPNGASTTVNFRVGIGSSVVQPEGTYTATTTLTLIAL